LDNLVACASNAPNARIVVDGHSSTRERRGIARDRALAVRTYLVEQRGIPAANVLVRSFDDTCPAADCGQDERCERYVDYFVVPAGREPDEIEKRCGDVARSSGS